MKEIPPVYYQLNQSIFKDDSTEYISMINIRPQTGSNGDNFNLPGDIHIHKEADNNRYD